MPLINVVKNQASKYSAVVLLPLSVLLINTSVLANEVSLASPNFDFPCDINLNTQVTIAPHHITFYQANEISAEPVYRINNNQLLINNSLVPLSSNQQQAMNSYDVIIRNTLHDVNVFLQDAFNLVERSVNQDFSALLGQNSAAIQTANDELIQLRAKFTQYFNPSNNVTIDNKGKFVDNVIGQPVDTYISALSQTLLSDATVGLMSSMLASGGSFSDIQDNIKHFSKQFKTTIKQQKHTLNTNAKQLCLKFNEIDKAEIYMQSQIPALANIDMFQRRTDL